MGSPSNPPAMAIKRVEGVDNNRDKGQRPLPVGLGWR